MTVTDMNALLYEAASKRIGVLVQSSDTKRLRETLYRLRAGLADSALDDLQFRIWPNDTLAICHKSITRGD